MKKNTDESNAKTNEAMKKAWNDVAQALNSIIDLCQATNVGSTPAVLMGNLVMLGNQVVERGIKDMEEDEDDKK